jgi:hypothetical protein
VSVTGHRQILVGRSSFGDELVNVVRCSVAVLVVVWLYLAVTVGDAADTARRLLPFQTLVQNRPPSDQRMFRELQEGLLEAEASRSMTGEWPAVESLAADGIPPFAPDPTAKQASYRWMLVRGGSYLNYLGLPDRSGAAAWVLVVQEPEPGVPPDQNFEDEEHHRLLDGTMLHVSTWMHTEGNTVPERLIRVPQTEGWTQVYAVGPGQAAPVAVSTP